MIRYAHTNIIAEDWHRLAEFYQTVFGCKRLQPERDLQEPWLARATAVPKAHLRGIHLRLPGHGDNGPTLEIFSYDNNIERAGQPASNRLGFGHIAFEVDNVGAVREAVLQAGGKDLGKTVSAKIVNAGTITFVYLTDPEGNIIELQSWQ